jgi:hypothetical protein
MYTPETVYEIMILELFRVYVIHSFIMSIKAAASAPSLVMVLIIIWYTIQFQQNSVHVSSSTTRTGRTQNIGQSYLIEKIAT